MSIHPFSVCRVVLLTLQNGGPLFAKVKAVSRRSGPCNAWSLEFAANVAATMRGQKDNQVGSSRPFLCRSGQESVLLEETFGSQGKASNARSAVAPDGKSSVTAAFPCCSLLVR